MDYDALFTEQLDRLKSDGNYRIFAELERQCGSFPRAKSHDPDAPDEVTVWCSNDYLGMGQHPVVRNAMKDVIDSCGCGRAGRAIYRHKSSSFIVGTRTCRSARQRKCSIIHIGICIELGGSEHIGI